ncbi:hypothetical protein GSI_05207 [Ganoderma sinense ZZ0214-1]|uniref:Uncharacterized protein n=1 Tax=Ganoderma sinense ZZ0214-1 TaxID=1077348 RepID=A0A2G8SFF5_9APHY|nr:hypothetical protein GSI_05207 [Ganoderma sinense ZZ0214-1]
MATAVYNASAHARGSTTAPSTRTLPRVFILSLQRRKFQEDHSQVFSGLIRNASINIIHDTDTAAATLSASPSLGDVVLVADGAILQHAHTALLYKLIHFAHEGATVVLAMDFYAELTPANARTFFGRWGLPWDAGDYLRTTFVLNPMSLPSPLSASALQPDYSMKAVVLKGVPRAAAVYLPGNDSHIESHVFAPTPIRGAEAQMTPAAFARVGRGYLGYVGDVNGEQGSTRLTIEMCGVKIRPGDMGCRRYVSSCSFRNGVVADEQITEEAEIPLPSAAETVQRAAPREDMYTYGSGVAMLGYLSVVDRDID